MTYYFSKKLDVGFAEAVQRTVDALKSEGFGVLTEIDVTDLNTRSRRPRRCHSRPA